MAVGAWRRHGSEARVALGVGYPPFAPFGRRRGRHDYLPAFVFHTAAPDDFEAKLRYLAHNGYSAVTLDEAVRWMRGEAMLPPDAVLLTIDDGRLTTWTAAYPLLRRYGMRATAFVIPGYLEDGPRRPTLDDVERREASRDDLILDERRDRRTFLRWSEVRALEASGVVHVESHTMLHREVPVAARASAAISPADLRRPPYELALSPDAERGWTAADIGALAGRPRYRSAPILTRRTGWAGLPGTVPGPPVPAGTAEAAGADAERAGRRAAVGAAPVPLARCRAWELEASKRRLEDEIGGKVVRHLCLPKGIGDDGVASLARAAGYESVCWGAIPDPGANRPGGDPFRIARVKHDFIWRLPGEGRQSLMEVFTRKAIRRLRGRTGF